MRYTAPHISDISKNDDYIVWNKSFETGIAFIDNEHKTLVKLCNDAYKLIVSNKDNSGWHDTVRFTIKECASYCQVHFSDEEKLMKAIGFEYFDAHKKRHDEFIMKVVTTARSFDSMTITDAISFVKSLYDWVLTHIAHEDVLYIKEALKKIDPDKIQNGSFVMLK